MYKVLGADGKEYGPVSAEQLRQWIVQRRLNAESLIQLEGQSGWKPLSFFPEFAGDLVRVAPPLPSTAPGSGPTNNMAVASFVMGLMSWLCFCSCGVFSVLGLVFGFISLSQIKQNPEQGGKALAIVGIVLSALGLLVSIIGMFSGVAAELFKGFYT